MKTLSRLAALVVALLLATVSAAACGGAAKDLATQAAASGAPSVAAATSAPQASPSPAPATASPTPEPTGTPGPSIGGVTPAPDSPSPTVAPSVAGDPLITQRFFKVWSDSIGYVHYQAVIEVSNFSDHPVGISGSGQDFTIYAKDDSVLETGSFTYAFPNVVATGAKGYLIESGYFDDGIKAKNVGKFEEQLSYTDETDASALMRMSSVHVSKESYGSGLQVSAVATNSTGVDVTDAIAGFIFLDAKGKVIGALYDNMVDRIPAGKSKGVKTSYPGTPPLKPSAVKKTIAIAFDNSWGF